MQEEKHWTEPACLPLLSKYLEGQMISGDIYSASAMSFSLCRQRRSPLFQHRNNVGGMPVLLHHAATSLINFTPSAVRSQRGALSPSVKYQTSSHSSPVRVCSIFGSAGRSSRSWSSARQYSHKESGSEIKCSGVAGSVSTVRLSVRCGGMG